LYVVHFVVKTYSLYERLLDYNIYQIRKMIKGVEIVAIFVIQQTC